jgi:hypothetical protein
VSKKFVILEVQRIQETTCVVSFDSRFRDVSECLEEIKDFAVNRVSSKRDAYFRDAYVDYEVRAWRQADDDEGHEAESMSRPENWMDKVMSRVLDGYVDPVAGVSPESRDGGVWRRVASLPGGLKAVVDGPGFDLSDYFSVSDGRRYGKEDEHMIRELREAFPGLTATDADLLSRLRGAMP